MEGNRSGSVPDDFARFFLVRGRPKLVLAGGSRKLPRAIFSLAYRTAALHPLEVPVVATRGNVRGSRLFNEISGLPRGERQISRGFHGTIQSGSSPFTRPPFATPHLLAPGFWPPTPSLCGLSVL
jgi:hypothetical protein